MTVLVLGKYIIFWILALIGLGLEVWALVDAVRYRAEEYRRAGQWQKPVWVAILAVTTLIGVLGLPLGGSGINPIGFLALIAVGFAIFYLVKPGAALKAGRGGRSGSGPYGGW